MKTDTPRAQAGPGEELHAIGAHAGIARTQPARQRCPFVSRSGLFSHNQKVVAAGVRLCKENQSSSRSRKVYSASIAGLSSSCPRSRSCSFLVATTVKL